MFTIGLLLLMVVLVVGGVRRRPLARGRLDSKIVERGELLPPASDLEETAVNTDAVQELLLLRSARSRAFCHALRRRAVTQRDLTIAVRLPLLRFQQVLSSCGTHLGSLLPDADGARYCIDLSCISGNAAGIVM